MPRTFPFNIESGILSFNSFFKRLADFNIERISSGVRSIILRTSFLLKEVFNVVIGKIYYFLVVVVVMLSFFSILFFIFMVFFLFILLSTASRVILFLCDNFLFQCGLSIGFFLNHLWLFVLFSSKNTTKA